MRASNRSPVILIVWIVKRVSRVLSTQSFPLEDDGSIKRPLETPVLLHLVVTGNVITSPASFPRKGYYH